ncbi:MAG TPA: hypothetical protein VK673_13070 [Chthoniobacterales bacterium]|nr:hypothetical protein [Chthoniobacterales bacterium]
MASTSSPPQTHFSRSSGRVFEPLESISSYPSHLVRWRECADSRYKLSSYVFIGQRTNNLPVRMAFVAGLRSHDDLAQQALAKLLVELEVAPLVGRDYALFSYALTRQPSELGEIGGNDWLDESSGVQPILQVLESDLASSDVDGFISIATNERVSGFQFETDSELIATEVAWPTLEVAGRFVPLAQEPVKVLPSAVLRRQRGLGRGVPKQMFGLTLRTSEDSGSDEQVSAIVFSSIRVLQEYRRLRRAAVDL